MNTNQALKLRDQARARVYDVYSAAKRGQWASADLFKREHEAMIPIQKCPQWVKTCLEGIRYVLFDRLWHDELETGYEIDGVIYSTYKNSIHLTTKWLIEEGLGYRLTDKECHAYWRGTSIRFS